MFSALSKARNADLPDIPMVRRALKGGFVLPDGVGIHDSGKEDEEILYLMLNATPIATFSAMLSDFGPVVRMIYPDDDIELMLLNQLIAMEAFDKDLKKQIEANYRAQQQDSITRAKQAIAEFKAKMAA